MRHDKTSVLLTVDEVARELRVHRTTVYERLNDKSLPSVTIGRSRRIHRDDLDAYKTRCRAQAIETAAEREVWDMAADDIAAYYDVHPRTARRLLASKVIPSRVVDGVRRARRADVEAYTDRQRRAS